MACGDSTDPSTLTFASISAASGYTCGVTAERDVYCWGVNLDGQLGDGTERQGEFPGETQPTRVVGGLQFRSIAVGSRHSCSLTPAGEAYCWGLGGLGQRGDGKFTFDASSPVPRAHLRHHARERALLLGPESIGRAG
jgi:alpha-tubulin suppressor-like RCC1 family protein